MEIHKITSSTKIQTECILNTRQIITCFIEILKLFSSQKVPDNNGNEQNAFDLLQVTFHYWFIL